MAYIKTKERRKYLKQKDSVVLLTEIKDEYGFFEEGTTVTIKWLMGSIVCFIDNKANTVIFYYDTLEEICEKR